ncbi:RsmB/NOP family class I SAM-dependent RNA methyltransferase [Thalassovita sp.]|uniref:RsmB/NOP family class I SAM-dependent RNA methyltransferase n=1 Tax=Thalassovita sp. TaxID=1979401 RepID=UPI0029DE72B8|nr:RsmB/NOP family class I SAM-dependent RNA methyltransferase [Thalassovita sp.]
MTPEARIATAADLLDTVLAGEPAEKALTGWARRSRFAGSKDRAAIRDHVFDALRCKRSFAALGGAMTGRGLMIGMLRAQGRDPADIFTGFGHAPAPLEATEAAAGAAPAGAEALDLPDWIAPLFRESLGPEAETVAQTLRARAPVMLRVNLRKATRDQAIAALAQAGVTAQPATVSETALLVTDGPRRINGSAPYLDGIVELQDGASQAVVDSLPLRQGMKVLDYCAGGGGKTLAMAGRCAGTYFAHDANFQRMNDLPNRADRAGLSVRLLSHSEVADHAPYDLVLCDVPCSGSGSWRRSPEGKWALSPATLSDLNVQQDFIMDETQQLVAENGVLIYATCSVLRAENDDRVAAFLSRHPGWRCDWARQWTPGSEGDGFFAACLTRYTL